MVIPVSFAVLLIPIRLFVSLAAEKREDRQPIVDPLAHAVRGTRSDRFRTMLVTQHANAPLVSGLVALARRLEDALQRQQTFAPQLELFSSEPHVVTCRYRLLLELDAELIVFDQPFAGSLAPH